MGLSKKIQKNTNKSASLEKSSNAKNIASESLFNEDNKDHIKKNITLCQKIALSGNLIDLENVIRTVPKLNGYQQQVATKRFLSIAAENSQANFFITLSMPPCFSQEWTGYDRDRITQKLHKSTLIFLKKIMLHFDPSLKSVAYERWPFFLATMEHFDQEGNLVAPHMHIILRLNTDLTTLRKAIEGLWGKAVPEAGKTGIDVQVLDKRGLSSRARYIFKHSFQDENFRLRNGSRPEQIAQRYGWSNQSVSQDLWMIDRSNFRRLILDK